MDISILMVNYKTSKLAVDAISSIKDKTHGISYEIIVVDNGSNDNSLNDILKVHPNVICKDAGGNLGFGLGNNFGSNFATGKYLFLLNTDTLLKNNAIKILFDYMEANPKVGVCGGNLFDYNDKLTHSFGFEMPSVFTTFKYVFLPTRIFVRGKKANFIRGFNDSGMPLEVGYITGADMMLRRDVFFQVGGFDKDFFMYCEESEMTNRIRKLGLKVMSVPNAEIIHLEGASFGEVKKEFNAKRYKMMLASQYIYYEKVYNKFKLKCYYYLTRVAYWLRKNQTESFFKERLEILNFTYKEWLKSKKK